VQEPNWEDNEFVQQIWIAVPATGERYALTSARKSSADPRWSPDSRRLAFTSERDGKRQIYVIAPAGGEAAQITTEENGVGQFAWSPNGGSIAFTSTGPESKARKDRKEKYGELDIIGGDYAMERLWQVKVPAEIPANVKELPKPRLLTEGAELSVVDFAWSPDGSRMVFSAARDPDLGSRNTEQLYVLDLDELHVRKLATYDGPNSRPQWSPDGKQIAFETAGGQASFYYANLRIAVIAADGGSPRILTKGFDENANLIDWGEDGIYFTALQKTSGHLFRLNPGTGAASRISGPEKFYVAGASFTKDHRMVAGVGAATNQFAEVFLILLCYKITISCRIVLWAKRLRQAHRNCALRHISRAWPKPQGMPTVTLL
jgi:Tol biopolymer transport system component